jgi:hypothetical protein
VGENLTLGRRPPTTWEHYEKFPLSALGAAEVPVARPVTIGVNWYSNFDSPILKSNRWWIGIGDLGRIRGGHCVCLKTSAYTDPTSWWYFYNQGSQGACVGYGSSRMMSLLNRVRYNARWLWDQAKIVDEWTDTNPGDNNGTSVNAAMKVLASMGHERVGDKQPRPGDGISAYRWASTVDEVRSVLSTPLHDRLQAVPILNSWGRSYPHLTWLGYDVLERLIQEDGEVAIVTDR